MNDAAMPPCNLLIELPLFQCLGAAGLERLAAGITEVCAPAGSLIFRRGDTSRSLHIVVSGQVKLALQTAQGGEHVVELVGPGGTFGETSLFLNTPRVLTAEALADTRLVQVAKATVLAELERSPELMRAIIANVSRRLQKLLMALEDCTLRSGTERVVGYLLNNLPPNAINGRAMITLPAKKGVIASQLNLTHEHFSRILHGLVAEAMIQVEGGRVLIPDVGKLRAYGFN
jgi:CRP-like cAMP-binding protein